VKGTDFGGVQVNAPKLNGAGFTCRSP
jgi:hypothetical protein